MSKKKKKKSSGTDSTSSSSSSTKDKKKAKKGSKSSKTKKAKKDADDDDNTLRKAQQANLDALTSAMVQMSRTQSSMAASSSGHVHVRPLHIAGDGSDMALPTINLEHIAADKAVSISDTVARKTVIKMLGMSVEGSRGNVDHWISSFVSHMSPERLNEVIAECAIVPGGVTVADKIVALLKHVTNGRVKIA